MLALEALGVAAGWLKLCVCCLHQALIRLLLYLIPCDIA